MDCDAQLAYSRQVLGAFWDVTIKVGQVLTSLIMVH